MSLDKKAENVSVLVYGIGHTLSGFEQNKKCTCKMIITGAFFYYPLKQKRVYKVN
jgi:hypothetical protein